jgi:isoleucyl-tRNA synthetase
VRNELDSYRLYTVVKEKVKFLDWLSNWYIKFNRSRMKGEISA